MTTEQVQVLDMLAKIDKGLPAGVSLTFAVDNLAETMDVPERELMIKIIHSLITEEYLTKHTDKTTSNGIPFWLEFSDKGRKNIN